MFTLQWHYKEWLYLLLYNQLYIQKCITHTPFLILLTANFHGMNILRTISRKSFTPNQDKDSLITSVYSSNLSGGFRFLFPSICLGSLLRFCLLLALLFCLINLLFLCFCLIGLLTAVSTKVFPAFKSCCNDDTHCGIELHLKRLIRT